MRSYCFFAFFSIVLILILLFLIFMHVSFVLLLFLLFLAFLVFLSLPLISPILLIFPISFAHLSSPLSARPPEKYLSSFLFPRPLSARPPFLFSFLASVFFLGGAGGGRRTRRTGAARRRPAAPPPSRGADRSEEQETRIWRTKSQSKSLKTIKIKHTDKAAKQNMQDILKDKN